MSARELYFETKPNLRHLRVFGSIVYVHIPKEKRRKLDAKAEKCILVGYSEEQKGYKCYNPHTKQARVSRDIVFDESASWYLSTTPDLNSNLSSEDEVSEAEIPFVGMSETGSGPGSLRIGAILPALALPVAFLATIPAFRGGFPLPALIDSTPHVSVLLSASFRCLLP